MTDAKTQRLMDELVTLRRENLALRLSKAQLEDVIKQQDANAPGFIGADGEPRRIERAPHLTRCLCAGMGVLEVTGAENRNASEGQPAGAAGEPGAWPKACPQCGAQVPDDYFHFVHWRSTWPDSRYCLQGHLLMRGVSLGYADFDRSIAKAGSEEDGSV